MSQFARDYWDHLERAQLSGEFNYQNTAPATYGHNQQRFVLNKIEDAIVAILNDIRTGNPPCLRFRSRTNWNSVSFDVEHGLIVKDNAPTSLVSLCRKTSRVKFGLCLKVLSIVYKLLQSNQIVTKRELYYEDPKLFKSQTVLDHLVDDIGCMLDIPRHMLNIVATSKGCIFGDLYLNLPGDQIIDCSESASGVLVPANINAVVSVVSRSAKFILVIEKDATYQRLLAENIPSLLCCIMITGKGVPDVNTRFVTRYLSDSLRLPVFGLFDADPHGVEIMCIYRFGSLSLAYDSHSLAVKNMRWIGVFPGEITSLALPQQALLPFSERDVSKCRELLKRPYMDYHPRLVREVKILQQLQLKAEIQALSSVSSTYLSDVYLPSKIKRGDWF